VLKIKHSTITSGKLIPATVAYLQICESVQHH